VSTFQKIGRPDFLDLFSFFFDSLLDSILLVRGVFPPLELQVNLICPANFFPFPTFGSQFFFQNRLFSEEVFRFFSLFFLFFLELFLGLGTLLWPFLLVSSRNCFSKTRCCALFPLMNPIPRNPLMFHPFHSLLRPPWSP